MTKIKEMFQKLMAFLSDLAEDKPLVYVILCYCIGFIIGSVSCLVIWTVLRIIDSIFGTNLTRY